MQNANTSNSILVYSCRAPKQKKTWCAFQTCTLLRRNVIGRKHLERCMKHHETNLLQLWQKKQGVVLRLGTSWDRTKWPWRRRNRHPQTGEPSSGSHSFQKCSVSWTCLALSFTKGTRCTSSNVKRCEEMRRDVKWCEVMWSDVKWCEDSSLPLLYKKLKWCLSLTSNCSHICGFPFLDVHPARAWNTSVSKVSTYRTVVITTCFERWKQDQEIPRQPGSALLHPQNLWFTSPSDKNSPSHPLPGNCSLWISV